jgi:hypothetical protein
MKNILRVVKVEFHTVHCIVITNYFLSEMITNEICDYVLASLHHLMTDQTFNNKTNIINLLPVYFWPI